MTKKYTILIFCFFFSFLTVAQDRNSAIDNHLLLQLKNQNLLSTDIANYKITSQHTSRTSGVTHLYFRQTYNGVEVIGTESSLHIKNGNIIKANNSFLKDINQRIDTPTPTLNEVSAIQAIVSKMGYTQKENLSLKSTVEGTKVYSNAGISLNDIPVKMVYKSLPYGKLMVAWEISIRETSSMNWYDFFVDGRSGDIMEKINWTVSCTVHDHSHDTNTTSENGYTSLMKSEISSTETSFAIGDGSYNVYPIPVESPLLGEREIVVNPHNLVASPFGWHDTNGVAGAEFTVTQGNNVNAYEDGDNQGYQPDGGEELTFDFPVNTVYSVGDQSEDAAITNLFYWSNVIHDVLYLYGLDESSGNFQVNNYGNGGLGTDPVLAEAQDSSGACNANFGTPPDGTSGVMQMYTCGARDGDFDNQVIIHEYGHGISNRLTGGPSNSGCLSNDEQMGEGWSDWYGTVLTIKEGDIGADLRPVGNWLFEQDENGPGIRDFPYSTDLSVDPRTYDYIQNTSGPHPLGSTWGAMLWEVTWALIDEYGFDPDIYNGTGGNNIVLALVTEGLKMQPCSPGFVDGRDAILAADIALYGGVNQCLIWNAFAKRGLGVSADQGSSNSRFDGTEAFDSPATSLEIEATSFCFSEGDVILSGGLPTGGTYSGPGVTDNGDGQTFTFNSGIAGIGIHEVSYTAASDCEGGDTATDTIEVTDINPIIECQDITVVLEEDGTATITPPDVVTNFLQSDGYTVDLSGEFNPVAISGTSVSLGDDQVSTDLPIGFDFVFFGETYSTFRISSNGFISFGFNTNSGCCSGAFIPSGVINNFIALAWEDLLPSGAGISYSTIGSAPNRVLIVDFDNVSYFGGGGQVTSQAHLYEGSGLIEIHSLSIDENGTKTQGIENLTGTNGYFAPGRNASFWGATNDYVGFIPNTGDFPDTCGNETIVTIDIDAFTCDDLGENTVTATATDSEGNISTCTSTVTVISNINVTFELDEVFCEDQDVIAGLGGGLPIGGVYSGVGISDDGNGETFTFDPSIAGAGTNEITYTTSNSCDSEGSATVTVDVLPAIPDLICENVEISLNESGELTIGPETILSNSGIEGIMPGDGFLYAVDPFGGGIDDISRYIYNPVSDAISVDPNYNYSTNIGTNFALDQDMSSGVTYLLARSTSSRNLYSIDLDDPSSVPVLLTAIVSNSGNTNPQDMVFDDQGNLYFIFQSGEIEILNTDTLNLTPFTTVAAPGGSVGMTFDFDNNRLLIVSGSNPVNLLQVNASTGASTILFSFDSPESTFCGAQAIEYIGDNKVVVSSTSSCNAVYTLDTITEETTVLLDPSNTFFDIKELHFVGLLPTDNCSGEPLTFTVTPNTFTCDNLGENEVTITATDANGNTSSCVSIVTIVPFDIDVTFTLSEIVFCEDDSSVIELGGGLPEGGIYSGPGVTDNGNGLTFIFDPVAAGVGNHDIEYTANTSCDEQATATVTIEVLPGIPDLECQDITIGLDETCEITLTPELLLSGGDSGFLYALDPFNSSNNISRYTYNNVNDEIVVDDLYSYSTGLSRGFALDQNPTTQITYLLGGFSSDRNLYSVDLNNQTSTPTFLSDILSVNGDSNPQDMVFDSQGNLYFIFQGGEINVFDVENLQMSPFVPNIATSGSVGVTFDDDSERLLITSGTGTINLLEVPLSSGIPETLFSYAGPGICSGQALEYLGDNKVVVSSTLNCNTIYTIDLDTEEISIILNPTGTYDNIKELHFISSLPVDNCTGEPLTFEIIPPVLTCDDVGENEVTVIATDSDGNTSTCTSTVTILGPLEITCIDITVQLGVSGTVIITPDDVLENNTEDATLSVSEFNCDTIGENIVTVTVNQGEQTGSCEAIVTVVDTLAPVVVTECPADMTVEAEIGETTYILEDFTIDIFFDECSIESVTQVPAAGTVFNVGDVIDVVLFATDPSGNESEACSFTITVNEACGDALQTGLFTGQYFMQQLTPGVFGDLTFRDATNSPFTLFETETDASQNDPFISLGINQRSFDANYLAELGFEVTRTYIFELDTCSGTVTFTAEENTGLSCSEEVILGPLSGGEFNPEDDSEFILSFEDNITDQCSEGTANILIRFTREPLSVDDNTLSAGIDIFPNPTSDTFTILNRNGIPLQKAVVTDVRGRVLKKINLEDSSLETSISLKDYANGLYFVQIFSIDGVNSVKQIIKRTN